VVDSRSLLARRCAATAVVACGVALFAANFLWVVSARYVCPRSPNGFCSPGKSFQSWWGLSTTSDTWLTGDTNTRAALFVLSAIVLIVWGLLALRSRQRPALMLVSAGITAGLVAVSLALNLEQLARFDAFWSPGMSLSSRNGLVLTVVASTVAVVALVVASGNLQNAAEAAQPEIRQSKSVYVGPPR